MKNSIGSFLFTLLSFTAAIVSTTVLIVEHFDSIVSVFTTAKDRLHTYLSLKH